MSVDALDVRTTQSLFAALSNDTVSYGVVGYHTFGCAPPAAELVRPTRGTRCGQSIVTGPDASASGPFLRVVGLGKR